MAEIKKRAYLLIGILLFTMLFLSSCKGECRSNSDCGDCFKCEDKRCVSIPNCCGNEKCEPKAMENQCSCSKDCGECTAEKGLQRYCDNNICEYKSVPQLLSHQKDLTGFAIDVTVKVDQPFNVKRSVIHFEAEMSNTPANVKDQKLTKLQLKSKEEKKDIVIAEKEIRKPFWGVGAKVAEDINVDYQFARDISDYPLALVVFYEYTEISPQGEKVVRKSYEKDIKSIKVVVPKTEYKCDERLNCDDNNPCTIDKCVEGTLLCRHTAKKECCGNEECEADENKATCPKDCGPCEGSLTEHLEYRLEEDSCSIAIKPGVGQKTTLTNEKTVSGFSLTVKNSFDVPFDIDNDAFNVEIALNDFDISTVELPITITRIQFLEKNLLLGESTGPIKLLAAGKSAAAAMPMSFTMKLLEEQKDVAIKVFYSYNKIKAAGVVELDRGSFDIALSQKVVFVNPG